MNHTIEIRRHHFKDFDRRAWNLTIQGDSHFLSAYIPRVEPRQCGHQNQTSQAGREECIFHRKCMDRYMFRRTGIKNLAALRVGFNRP